jgi:hypothetical protein
MLRHQKLALAWMCRREQSKRVSGGILADDQGLGKTVTTIALVLAHPREGAYLQVPEHESSGTCPWGWHRALRGWLHMTEPVSWLVLFCVCAGLGGTNQDNCVRCWCASASKAKHADGRLLHSV